MATAVQRISTLEARMDETSRAISDLRALILALEQKMERRFDQLDRRFMWLIGMQFSTLLTIIAMLLRRS